MRAKDFIRGRNLRWFGIHGLSPLQTHYASGPFDTSVRLAGPSRPYRVRRELIFEPLRCTRSATTATI
jgi:hypothetical protein